MVLSLCCDFRVMTGNRGMMSMNEIFLGVPLPNSFNTLLKQRMSYPALRDTLLGKRWKQSELLAAGIIDEIVDDSKDPKAVVKRAIELGTEEGPKVAKGAWGGIKEGVYHDYIDSSRSHRQLWLPDQKEKAFWDRLDRNNKAKL
jgi:enoyl-CoA hydratase/carnithine racemase